MRKSAFIFPVSRVETRKLKVTLRSVPCAGPRLEMSADSYLLKMRLFYLESARTETCHLHPQRPLDDLTSSNLALGLQSLGDSCLTQPTPFHQLRKQDVVTLMAFLLLPFFFPSFLHLLYMLLLQNERIRFVLNYVSACLCGGRCM